MPPQDKTGAVAVILFPGTNCENETLRALAECDIDAELFRWNTLEDITVCAGVVIPGGFSYQDRIRAGVIASHDPIMKQVKKMAEEGKPVLGICNGAQVLVESGLVPGRGKVELALAPNINSSYKGFYCAWTHIRNAENDKPFTCALRKGEIIPIPIAHGEGRFAAKDRSTIEYLQSVGSIAFAYSDESGENTPESNPNGSLLSAAGITNRQGNVLALMPHPERAAFTRQLPFKQDMDFGMQELQAPAARIFHSMKKYIHGMQGKKI